MNSGGKRMLCLARGNKIGRKEVKPLLKFKDILGERNIKRRRRYTGIKITFLQILSICCDTIYY